MSSKSKGILFIILAALSFALMSVCVRLAGEISTFEVLMKINGYKWGSKELDQLEELDLFEVHGRLLRLIKKEKEYVADFSAYEGMYIGLPYNIPFVFRKKH